MQFYGTGMLFFGIFVSLAYLICGIYLLKLSNSARKSAIVLGIISIISIPFYSKPVLQQMNFDEYYYSKHKQMIIERMKPEFQQKALEDFEKAIEISKKVFPIVIMVILILYLIFELIPIYFFTRPKVKAQFSPERGEAESKGAV